MTGERMVDATFFDEDLKRPNLLAAHDRGWVVVPVLPRSKKVVEVGWTSMTVTRRKAEAWARDPGGFGIRLDGLVCIDIDVTDRRVARLMASEAAKRLPGALVRVGRFPKVAFLARLDAGAVVPPKLNLTDGDGQAGQKVEFLSDCKRQLVAGGIHPDTGHPYRWTTAPAFDTARSADDLADGAAPWAVGPDTLPAVGAEDLGELRVVMERVAEGAGWSTSMSVDEHGKPASRRTTEGLRLCVATGVDWHDSINEYGLRLLLRGGDRFDVEDELRELVMSAERIKDKEDRLAEISRSLDGAERKIRLIRQAESEALRPTEDDERILSRLAGADEPAVTGGRQSRFRLHSWDEMMSWEPPPWLIHQLLPEGSLTGIVGPYGTFKSFVAIDMGLSVASGQDYHGRRVRQGDVVYVAGEGSRGTKQRVVGWVKKRGVPGRHPFHIVDVAVPLGDPPSVKEFVAEVRKVCEKPALVIIDTLARSTLGLDENSAADAGRAVAAMDAIRERLGATIIFVHHTGKDVGRGSRGSTAIPAAVDVEFTVERKDGLRVQLTTTKAKDHGEDAPLLFDMEVVETGLRKGPGPDDPPEVVTSLVPVRADPATVKASVQVTGPARIKVVEALRRLVDKGKRPLFEADLQAAAEVVSSSRWSQLKADLAAVFEVVDKEVNVLVGEVDAVEGKARRRIPLW
jgi:hypothetical protein